MLAWAVLGEYLALRPHLLSTDCIGYLLQPAALLVLTDSLSNLTLFALPYVQQWSELLASSQFWAGMPAPHRWLL